ncbi:flagellar brake protein [Asaccharospora irregularis]|uniref:C-di-GMP-binding flagellar brake protein YcgR, contains PilZNR and PilZ domains n=1 Tax=Asaccharospora irregularis DSM 2635 TaxID=1121321 RepID=A0A1M5LE40_9FIRM|nr:PilZ domain-containing protein [Asaccharospora irregularis]SHG62623.1 c-di-GMP-binding flagellar brake protein YcgR, contains PilZNR and PilZ domains [Asaccharospora irregularis DSM 2635]
MFNLLNRKSIKSIERSIDKYNEVLVDDINLKMRIRCRNKIYTTDVEFFDNREVVFRCPIDRHDIIRFNNKSIVKVDFVSYSGLYITELLITEKIMKDDVLYYRGEINSPIEKRQRRKDYRLPITLDLSYTLLPREYSQYSGSTLDISSNGMLMETYENIYQTKKLKINIDIDGKKYTIKGTVLRKRNNFSNGTYLYNIKFDDLSSRNKSEIARFIFDTKRALVKN